MCLGCGCGCDDITIHVQDGRIAAAERACPRGAAWFGDGAVPARARVGGREAAVPDAVSAAARMLAGAARPLVLLADDLSCEAQGAGVAIADRLGAMLDSLTTATLLPSVLASQRRGRATATFGEIRNRGDVILFWGFDPGARYPRFRSRIAPEPAGLEVSGRRGRTVLAADVGDGRGPEDVDHRVRFTRDEEEDALALMRSTVLRRAAAPLATGGMEGPPRDDLTARAAALAERLMAARYAVIVHDAERGGDAGRSSAEALIALAQALNGPTRCALCSLREGGNRAGADSVVTWSTGFPLAVDFARGAPRYRPLDAAAAMLARGEIDVALVLGSLTSPPATVRDGLRAARCIAIGPRASESALDPAVAVDTGIAGIHDRGVALRADDVPLPLRPALHGERGVPPEAVTVLRALLAALGPAR